jgi:diguanylate cyclase
MTLHPISDTIPTQATALSRDLLAVIVAIVAFGSTSAFLLALVPDGTPDLSGILPYGRPAQPRSIELAGSAAAASPEVAPPASAKPAANGYTPPAEAAFRPAAQETWADVEAASSVAAPPKPAAVIPVQKDGATHYLPVGRVHAVKAEAHYTMVFDGTHKFFCSLSITDVEGRLDQARFVRVHRSHIVAVDRITSLKKSGDGGVAELNSSTPYSLPVSRRKLSELRALLDTRA